VLYRVSACVRFDAVINRNNLIVLMINNNNNYVHADYTTIIAVSSVIGAIALIAFIFLFQFVR